MFAIGVFGLGMVGISLALVARPDAAAEAVRRFVRLRYFHPFEIVTRLGFGVLFVLYADQSKFPTVIRVFGYILVAVGLALMVTPPSYHRRFGIWSVDKFSKYFRVAGLGSLAFGVLLVYAVI